MDTRITHAALKTEHGVFKYFKINDVTRLGLGDPKRLPFSIRILLENALRHCDGFRVTAQDVERIASWQPHDLHRQEIAFNPSRVILQDFTGVPCVVDLAAMRAAVKRLGGDISKINPLVPCDLVIDHSLQIDAYGCPEAFAINMQKEFERNAERYAFLKWGQEVFKNFRVVPPGTGIIHQVNLEYLAHGVITKKRADGTSDVFFDSVVGTDSHTTMINGLGILGWGVGGIEAEAVMLGEPITMLLPEVIGFELTGRLRDGVTATDLVLTIVEILRKKGVVGKFVEYIGDGLAGLSLPDRATIANMAPEYGATAGMFPIDHAVLEYYALTGRDPKQIDLIEQYTRAQGMFYSPGDPRPEYSDILRLDLDSIEPSIAGPKRPQDRITLRSVTEQFNKSLTSSDPKTGFGLTPESSASRTVLPTGETLTHGSVVIASITSCTNTSNPAVLIAAGLLAQKAVTAGLRVPGFVKTSFAPGSQVVEDYLASAGLLPFLEQLGFHIAGYGCATCIGNSGPLRQDVANAITTHRLVAASVLSGNRNFEGRVNPLTRANYLASPPLVVAYALAGRVTIDFDREPIGMIKGHPVYLKDIWPSQAEIDRVGQDHVEAQSFIKRYQDVGTSNEKWNVIASGKEPLFDWPRESTYIQEPPFLSGMTLTPAPLQPIQGARVLLKLGDSITTDHISPAGSIAPDSPAGRYLTGLGVAREDFNSYGARRGNDRVMTRGTFANIRLRNQLAPGTEGSWTRHFPSGDLMSVFDAAERYRKEHIPLIVLAGKEYGTGSSRDWAAKGPALLGIRAVIAQSFERIHRSNLAGMGILPLQFHDGESTDSLGLTGAEVINLSGIETGLTPGKTLRVTALPADGGRAIGFDVVCRLDTPVEVDYFRHEGILPAVVRKLITDRS